LRLLLRRSLGLLTMEPASIPVSSFGSLCAKMGCRPSANLLQLTGQLHHPRVVAMTVGTGSPGVLSPESGFRKCFLSRSRSDRKTRWQRIPLRFSSS
jgi:hypothetical protein